MLLNVSFFDTDHRLLDIKQVWGSRGFLEGQQTGTCGGDISGSILAILDNQIKARRPRKKEGGLANSILSPHFFPFSLSHLLTYIPAGSGSGAAFMASNNNNNNKRAKNLL